VLSSRCVGQDRYSQWLRGVLDLCVLALVSRRETYGYELSRSLESAGFGPVQGGTLYPILTRLQGAGLIAARWRGGDAGPARKYYRITTAGDEALRASAADWRTFTADVDAVLPDRTVGPGAPVGTATTRGVETMGAESTVAAR
jgi:PadR family transcriptional regulator, regulatory protein PadR